MEQIDIPVVVTTGVVVSAVVVTTFGFSVVSVVLVTRKQNQDYQETLLSIKMLISQFTFIVSLVQNKSIML
jgi:hypothetical protein